MSNMLGQTTSRDQTRTLPQGETVGTYAAYLDAQKAVDYLADQQFAVTNVSILGNDLKTVERVTGRLSYPRVALAGAATGAWFGLFVGVVLMLFGGTETYSTLLSSMALGAGFWMLFGVITYAMQRGKRDFTSTSQVVASNYQVIVAPEAAGEARRLLQQLPMNGRGGPSGPGYGPGQGTNQYGPGHGPNQYGPGQGPGQYGPGQYGPGPYGSGQSYGQGSQGSQGSGQGGQGSRQGGQAPERPAGWEDPYQDPKQGTQHRPEAPAQGWQPGASGAQPDPHRQDQPQNPDQQPQAQPQQPEQQGPRRGQFPDLPDGRPQYGERLPAAQPAQEEQAPAAAPNPNPAPHAPQPTQDPAGPEQPERPPYEPGQEDHTRPDAGQSPQPPETDSTDGSSRGSKAADEDDNRQ